ncbi:MAG: hypothetical protein WCJ01_08395 [Ignavibacteria bacterium]
MAKSKYDNFTREQLLDKIKQLEGKPGAIAPTHISETRKISDEDETVTDEAVVGDTPVQTKYVSDSRIGSFVKYKNEPYIIIQANDNGTIQIYSPWKEGTDAKKSISADNLEFLTGKANLVSYKSKDYLATQKGIIISLATNKKMDWGDENGDRKAILALAAKTAPTKPAKTETAKVLKAGTAVNETVQLPDDYYDKYISNTDIPNTSDDDNDTATPDDMVSIELTDSHIIIELRNVRALAVAMKQVLGGDITGKDYIEFIQRFTFTEFLSFRDILLKKDTENNIKNALYAEWEHSEKHKMTFDEFVNKRLRMLWNMNSIKKEQTVLDIVYSSIGENDSKTVSLLELKQNKGAYKNTIGRTKNTNRAGSLMERFLEPLGRLLGCKVELVYINGFTNGYQGELKGFHDARGMESSDLSRLLYEYKNPKGETERYIYTNVYGDKSTIPIFKITGNIDTSVIDEIARIHKEHLGKLYQEELAYAGKVSNAVRVMIEELRLGNSVENISSYSAKTARTLGMNLATLMKRSYLVSDNQYISQDDEILERLNLKDAKDPKRPRSLSENSKVIKKRRVFGS